MDQHEAQAQVARFVDSTTDRSTLGLLYGRRRIGKSTLLDRIVADRGGFYWEAPRTESALQLARLGEALGEHLGVGRLALDSWHDAVTQLVRLGASSPTVVVLDEFGYVLEAEPSVDSLIATALGPSARRDHPGRTRLILCGSAIAMMRSLTAGEAPLRGRAALELVMQPFDYRAAAEFLTTSDLGLAARVFAVIGGVIGYATDVVDDDLPIDRADFDRWVTDRVLSPAATLHHEATTLLAEDPILSASSPLLQHSILGAIANGSVTAGTIANRLRRSVSNLDPVLKRLISAGFVIRHVDPIRGQRPTYALADPFLQFHYAILEPHRSLLRDRHPARAWEERLAAVFDARVRGPVFEQQARTWVTRHAGIDTIGGSPDHVGPSNVTVEGVERQLDIVVAAADEATTAPGERRVVAIGEVKSGEIVDEDRVRALERARSALGERAAGAKLLLFAPGFTREVTTLADARHDLELVDHHRLYHGW